MSDNNRDSQRRVLRVFGQIANIGFFMAASLLIGIYGGDWVDRYFNTQPFFTITGVILGVASGFFEFFSIMKKL